MDLNCDLGESFGAYHLGMDEQVMRLITSANVACGFHAGDPQVMRRTVAAAMTHGVCIGAHVGFPDLYGFGRREMQVAPVELENDVIYQIGALAGFCQAAGTVLHHVKPHGALYNMAQRDPKVAEPIARAIAAYDRRLLLYAQPGSVMAQVAEAHGLQVVLEVFADRAYTAAGALAARNLPGAVIHDPISVAARTLQMVQGSITAIDGTVISVHAQTICVHGDTPGSVALIESIRERLHAAGVPIAAPVLR